MTEETGDPEAGRPSSLQRWKNFALAGIRRPFPVAGIAIFLAVIYWGLVASDRYVSEADVVVDRTDLSGGYQVDLTAFLAGGAGSRSNQDLLLLRDHLRSIDMLLKLDEKLNLRAHHSDGQRDPISRLWFENAPIEIFHRHYLSRVSIELDDAFGILRIKTQAYTPEMALAITQGLVEEGERFMNDMAHRLASDQVTFLEAQVEKLGERVLLARNQVVDFQNAKGLLSPKATAEGLGSIVARLEGQLAELKAKREAMAGYLSPGAPDLAQVGLEIGAVENQLRIEKARLASPKGGTLNRTLEEFQRLETEAQFAQDIYRSALVSLEKGRVEATRNLKKVSIVQSPTHPQYPIEPRRMYNITVFALSALMLAGIAQLLAAIIRDHQD
ncbi:chain-length determining protein [Accumulibacter sp.]|uniref:chain-length determining protein n=1 Tax=Accumulibacter sp. TaxID=2053492 RepID=UPI0025DA065F|nr:chain-length determining protein [Accumulibacter sp.]MCM8612192.1 chain-length determining protein [Accumulibacter sp.]MCM8635865.1 chain-length determining protein [Accumulibacter sp.]MCM8639526.1 chain-length determining protein [Accumulibacter sp.]